ncbi:MAG: hypothetical protein DMD78_12535 [Candidatus Rokuibacteriota bacterium]|nr:MAG: hypothetical protein DMD78_12535 [Candidatus Rokubacteria bacterium]
MSDEPAKKKDELLRLLCDVESEATRVEALGQDIVRAARFTVDVVRPIRYVISQVPPEALPQDALDRQVDALRAWRVAAGEVEGSRTAVNSFNALSTAFSSAATGMIASVAFTPLLPPGVQADVDRGKSQLHQTLERFR